MFDDIKNQLAIAKSKIKRSVAPKNAYEVADMKLLDAHRAGDPNAKWDLLKRFDGLIADHAMKHSNVNSRSVVEAQLKQITLKAFDTYDATKGAKLSTHIVNHFKKLSRENIKNQQAIRLPENIALKYAKYTEGKTYLTDVLEREPTAVELSEHLGWGLDEVTNLSKRFHKELVESRQVYDPGVIDSDISKSALTNAYYSMSEPERYIIEHKLGIMGKTEKPAEQIRKELKMTPYLFNKTLNSAIGKVQEAVHILQREG